VTSAQATTQCTDSRRRHCPTRQPTHASVCLSAPHCHVHGCDCRHDDRIPNQTKQFLTHRCPIPRLLHTYSLKKNTTYQYAILITACTAVQKLLPTLIVHAYCVPARHPNELHSRPSSHLFSTAVKSSQPRMIGRICCRSTCCTATPLINRTVPKQNNSTKQTTEVKIKI